MDGLLSLGIAVKGSLGLKGIIFSCVQRIFRRRTYFILGKKQSGEIHQMFRLPAVCGAAVWVLFSWRDGAFSVDRALEKHTVTFETWCLLVQGFCVSVWNISCH